MMSRNPPSIGLSVTRPQRLRMMVSAFLGQVSETEKRRKHFLKCLGCRDKRCPKSDYDDGSLCLSLIGGLFRAVENTVGINAQLW